MALALLVLCLALLVYAHVGYPLLMVLLARWKPRPFQRDAQPGGGLSVVLCTANAENRIQDRLRNLLSCRWPGELDIVVFCDGCTDATAARAKALNDARIRVIEHPQSRGKASALNDALPLCRHERVVLCDVRQDFHEDALLELAAPFADPSVGAVSGRLEIAPAAAGSGQGIDAYWRMERKLREWEGRFDSVIGCTGAICAIRRTAFEPLNPATILDDVVIPMRLVVADWRVLYEPRALAFDPLTFAPAMEKRRKLRTLAGNYQMIEHFPEWLLPWHNRLWWQLISHKYLRLAVPWLLIAIALLTLLAWSQPLVRLLGLAQITAYSLALFGLLRPDIRSRFLTLPAGFLLLQITCLRALSAYLESRHEALRLWQPSTSTASQR